MQYLEIEKSIPYSELSKKIIYLKGLNGIRAIAALSVVISHTLMGLGYFGIEEFKEGWDFASYGVTMFFTLSGFLITYLLLHEKKSFNTISIKDFYIRRVLRIWPLYYFYIVVVLIVLMINFSQTLPGSVYYYLFMVANIPSVLNISLPLLTHYWSLGVEEEFYLFWPWLIKYFSPLKAVSFFLLLFFCIKGLVRIFLPGSLFYQFIHVTRFDCMAIGALFAILLNNRKKWFLLLSFNRITQVLSWAILLLAAIKQFRVPDFINQEFFSVASAVLILNVAFNEKPLVSLENKLFNFLGKISYGIYVYHVLLIYLLGLCLKGKLDLLGGISQVILVIFAVIVLTILVAWISYNSLEKWFLKFKDRFSKVLSRS